MILDIAAGILIAAIPLGLILLGFFVYVEDQRRRVGYTHFFLGITLTGTVLGLAVILWALPR
jgi:hypothetical protein